MALSNIDSLNLGNLLQIIFTNSVRNQLSTDYRDWEQVQKMRIGDNDAREIRFMFQTSLGPAAVQYRQPGTSNRAFPSAQQSSVSENTAKTKEINVTIEIEYNLWDRARRNPKSRYADALALEIESKAVASKRQIAKDFYGDGTGVVGQLSGAADDSAIASGLVTITLDPALRGFVSWFEFGDLISFYDDDGSPLRTTTANGYSVYRVFSKSRANNTVTLQILDGSGNVATTETASNIVDNDAAYRIGQSSIPNLTSNATIGDFGTTSEVMAGLESLTANDGRTVHGIVMSGSSAGSRFDGLAAALDTEMIQACLDNVKIAVGQDRYRYAKMSMAHEAHAALINSREDSRRFITVEDNKRGIRYFAYVHNNDTVETYTSEFVPKNRIYFLPESKSSSEKVVEYHGSDYATVKAQDMSDFHLKPGSSGSYVNMINSFLQATGVLICNHPAAVGVLVNFTL